MPLCVVFSASQLSRSFPHLFRCTCKTALTSPANSPLFEEALILIFLPLSRQAVPASILFLSDVHKLACLWMHFLICTFIWGSRCRLHCLLHKRAFEGSSFNVWNHKKWFLFSLGNGAAPPEGQSPSAKFVSLTSEGVASVTEREQVNYWVWVWKTFFSSRESSITITYHLSEKDKCGRWSIYNWYFVEK